VTILKSIFILLIGCQLGEPDWREVKTQIRKEFPEVRQLSIDEFRREYAEKAFVVDVRKPKEYKVSHLKNAVNLVTKDEIITAAKKSGKKAIVLYCSVGYRSSEMAQKVLSEAEIPVYNLEGSIFEWANMGLPVYRGEKRVDKIHPYNAYWGKLLDNEYKE